MSGVTDNPGPYGRFCVDSGIVYVPRSILILLAPPFPAALTKPGLRLQERKGHEPHRSSHNLILIPSRRRTCFGSYCRIVSGHRGLPFARRLLSDDIIGHDEGWRIPPWVEEVKEMQVIASGGSSRGRRNGDTDPSTT